MCGCGVFLAAMDERGKKNQGETAGEKRAQHSMVITESI
jgi:hypothetical protein